MGLGIGRAIKDGYRRVAGSRTIAYAVPQLTLAQAALGSEEAKENLGRAWGGVAVQAARAYGGDAGANLAGAGVKLATGVDPLAQPAAALPASAPAAPAYGPAPESGGAVPPLVWIIGGAVALVLVLFGFKPRKGKS